MLEAIIFLVAIPVGIAAIVMLIPVFVRVETDSERDPLHLWSLMWREAGPRGWHFSAPALCTIPFTLLAEGSKAYGSTESTFFILAVAIVGLASHTNLYRDVKIFDALLMRNLSIAVGLLMLLTELGRVGAIGGATTMVFGQILGVAWGTYVLYRRAREIRHNHSLQARRP